RSRTRRTSSSTRWSRTLRRVIGRSRLRRPGCGRPNVSVMREARQNVSVMREARQIELLHMRRCAIQGSAAWLLAAGLLLFLLPAAEWSMAQSPAGGPAAAGDHRAKAEQYNRARRAFDAETAAYWRSIAE